MSKDQEISRDLVKTLEDGREGFLKASEHLATSDRPEIAESFRRYSVQRGQFAEELKALGAAYGDDVDEGGSLAGMAHRGWMAMKDAMTGDDPTSVLDSAEQGEDHAVAEYEKALSETEISAGLREVLQRQFEGVKAAHDDVRAVRNANN